jgi:murein DD-endopeptidase MepM/ murein hydrolase activator NlpD
VEVDGYFFPGTAGLFPEAATHVALFATPQDLSTEVRPRAVAIDAAGNRREAGFFCSIKPQLFSQRTLEVSDTFLQRKVPEIATANSLSHFPDLLEGYLYINRALRQQTQERVRRRCSTSASTPLWEGPFLQQGSTQVMSSFADRRTYVHSGQKIDTQTHLGYDLASLRNSPVVAANTGKVVLAENLGIYGNSVIIDHGLGLFSLYGHLSSITTQEGQIVKKGETIGRTGDTGLAGGDHLHFSTMLYGVHVDPVEWWDGKWLKDHVQAKLPPPKPGSQPE